TLTTVRSDRNCCVAPKTHAQPQLFRRVASRRRFCEGPLGQYPDKMGAIVCAGVNIAAHSWCRYGHAIEGLCREALLQRLFKWLDPKHSVGACPRHRNADLG